MSQIFIAIFGSLAILLTQIPNAELKKYAPIVGLASQPFFHYETFMTHQWGMFILSIVVSVSWLFGLYNDWLKPRLNKPKSRFNVT